MSTGAAAPVENLKKKLNRFPRALPRPWKFGDKFNKFPRALPRPWKFGKCCLCVCGIVILKNSHFWRKLDFCVGKVRFRWFVAAKRLCSWIGGTFATRPDPARPDPTRPPDLYTFLCAKNANLMHEMSKNDRKRTFPLKKTQFSPKTWIFRNYYSADAQKKLWRSPKS